MLKSWTLFITNIYFCNKIVHLAYFIEFDLATFIILMIKHQIKYPSLSSHLIQLKP